MVVRATLSQVMTFKPSQPPCSYCNQMFRECCLTLTISDLVIYGVGYHHAGVDVSDRKMIETLFTAGELPVLCKPHSPTTPKKL